MKCDEYEILISAYADGELDGSEKTRVQNHISQCESCRRLYEDMTRLQRDVADVLKECPAVPELVSAVAARIRPRRGIRITWAWAAAAAVAVVAVCAYAVIRSIPDKEPSPRPIVVRHEREPASLRHAPKILVAVQPSRRVRRPERVRIVRHIASKKTLPIKRMAGGGAVPICVDKPQVTVEYTDAASCAEQSAGTYDSSPGPVPIAGPGQRVVAETDVVMENGKRTQRVCYRIIDILDGKSALNEPTKGEPNGTD